MSSRVIMVESRLLEDQLRLFLVASQASKKFFNSESFTLTWRANTCLPPFFSDYGNGTRTAFASISPKCYVWILPSRCSQPSMQNSRMRAVPHANDGCGSSPATRSRGVVGTFCGAARVLHGVPKIAWQEPRTHPHNIVHASRLLPVWMRWWPAGEPGEFSSPGSSSCHRRPLR